MSVQTNLLGEYVNIPDDGDAGWIRAVYSYDGDLLVLVQRDNVSKDFRIYNAESVTMRP